MADVVKKVQKMAKVSIPPEDIRLVHLKLNSMGRNRSDEVTEKVKLVAESMRTWSFQTY